MRHRDIFERPSQPVITIVVMSLAALNIIVATILDVYSQPITSQTWNWLGFFTAEQVRAGAVWAYITTIFPHGNLLHLAFNLSWMWPFGQLLETRANRWHYLALLLLTAWCGSGLQLLVAGEMGIGLSGVIYGFFGYAWIRGLIDPEVRLRRNIVLLFCGWFFVCIVITHLGWLRIGNAAHFGGFLAGAAYAPIQHARRLWLRALAITILLALLAATILPLI